MNPALRQVGGQPGPHSELQVNLSITLYQKREACRRKERRKGEGEEGKEEGRRKKRRKEMEGRRGGRGKERRGRKGRCGKLMVFGDVKKVSLMEQCEWRTLEMG